MAGLSVLPVLRDPQGLSCLLGRRRGLDQVSNASPRSSVNKQPYEASWLPFCPHRGSRELFTAPAWWALGPCWATHMAATHHATLTSSSPLGVPSPLWSAGLPGRTYQAPTRPLTSGVPSCSPDPRPRLSAHSFCPWLPATRAAGGGAGGDSCVAMAAAPSCPSPRCLSLMTAAQSKGRGLSQLPPPHAGIKCPPWLCSGARTIQGKGGLLGPSNSSGLARPLGDSLGSVSQSVCPN